MKINRRTLAITAIAATFMTTAAVPSLAQDDKRMGVLIYNVGVDPWINVAIRVIEETGTELGYAVTVADGRNDVSHMNAAIDQFVIQGVDAIIIHPADTESLVGSVSRAVAAGVPVVSFSHGLVDEANLTSFIAADEVQMGREQAELVVDLLNGEGNVALMTGILGTSGQLGRSEGQHAVFDQVEGIEVVEEQANDWQHDKAVALIQNWLSKYPKGELHAVISHGPELVAAAEYAQSQGRDEIVFVALDYPEDARQAIQEGSLYATINQDPQLMAKLAVEAADRATKGEPVDKLILIDAPMVTKDNVEDIPAAY